VASIYRKSGKLWARLKDASGKWIGKPTPYAPGEEGKAKRFAREAQRILDAQRRGDAAKPLTVEAFGRAWIKARRELGLVTSTADESRLSNHVFPVIGHKQLTDVRKADVRNIVLELRKRGNLAPRTIHNVWTAMQTMFHDAAVEDRITISPCDHALKRGDLPQKADKDPSWRNGAIYTREEVERLISDDRILPDRRVHYALQALAGMRHSEAAGMRWRDYDSEQEPLGCIALPNTKTKVPRRVPVHPVLARLLAAWKLTGWRGVYGRPPKPDDLVVPTRTIERREANYSWAGLQEDLATIGLRARRQHDLRRTFITLARVDGARKDLLEVCTHGPRREIVDVYTSFPWPALCAEVAKLRIRLRGVESIAHLATAVATASASARKRSETLAERMGFEPMLPSFPGRPA